MQCIQVYASSGAVPLHTLGMARAAWRGPAGPLAACPGPLAGWTSAAAAGPLGETPVVVKVGVRSGKAQRRRMGQTVRAAATDSRCAWIVRCVTGTGRR